MTRRGPFRRRRPRQWTRSPARSRWILASPPPTSTCRSLLVRLGRPEEARRNAEMHLALDPTSPNRSETRLAALLLDPHTGGSPEVERFLDTTSVFTLFPTFNTLAFWPDTAETVVRLVRRLGEPGRSAGGGRVPWVMDTVMWPQYLAHVLAFRGHLHEAFAVDELLLRQPSASPWSDFLDSPS